jgi:hypothetical protein
MEACKSKNKAGLKEGCRIPRVFRDGLIDQYPKCEYQVVVTMRAAV